ncbi:hypothetical protein [Phocaeicola oris]|uniref:hypothetical protein n=1 Tax=Phocaeicola oris TaxID=2896850 RepID=UPI00234F7C93|nr:hypothetical protein [Phocaeicola oris]MCE2616091.1 hypothetical protein [Phocaeicola oris]
MRQKIKEVMSYIRECSSDMNEEAYDRFLEELAFEIETERELCQWNDNTEDNK